MSVGERKRGIGNRGNGSSQACYSCFFCLVKFPFSNDVSPTKNFIFKLLSDVKVSP